MARRARWSCTWSQAGPPCRPGTPPARVEFPFSPATFVFPRFLGGHVPVSQTFSFYISQISPNLRSSSINQLEIEHQTNSVRVSWPDSDLTYRLEASSTPLTGWLPASGPAQTNGSRKSV